MSIFIIKRHGGEIKMSRENVKALATVIGSNGQIFIDGLGVDVRIIDVRQAYGRTDYRITPIRGIGGAWVDSKRVSVGDISGATPV